MEKHSVSRISYLFAHLHLLSSYSFSSDLLSANLPLLSASALLCFSSVHIVGSWIWCVNPGYLNKPFKNFGFGYARYLYIYISLSLSLFISVCLSVYLSVYVSTHLFLSLS